MEEEFVGIERLPEGCIARVLSLTSPLDVCLSAATCREFRSAGDSDDVWEGFLPEGYREILSRAVQPVPFQTKKQLYHRLCNSILIDSGRISFTVEKSTGKKCFFLSARELLIVWGNTPDYWTWTSLPESRFSEVAELRAVCWLEISGKINTKMLSQRTTYIAYLVYKLTSTSNGFEYPSQEGSIVYGNNSSTQSILLFYRYQFERETNNNYRWHSRPFLRAAQHGGEADPHVDQVPRVRVDGWMEIVLGEFFNDDGGDGDVVASLVETKGGHWKGGLVVQGIEFRPKN